MKTVSSSLLSFTAILFAFSFLTASSQAMQVEGNLDYPVVIGNVGQGFTSNLGLSGAFYANPILDPNVNNFLSVGYSSLTLKADGKTSLRLIPVLVGIELPGKVFEDLHTTFAIAAGGTVAYLNTNNSQNMNLNGYFTAQVKPGLSYSCSSSFDLYVRMPVTYYVGTTSMSTIAYSMGAQIKL